MKTQRPSAAASVPPCLWREALGRVLRVRRTELALTLVQVSRRSGVSTQYLSEVERGLKDPSSEVIEAIAAVLGLPLPRVLLLAAVATEHGSAQLAGLSALASVTELRPATGLGPVTGMGPVTELGQHARTGGEVQLSLVA